MEEPVAYIIIAGAGGDVGLLRRADAGDGQVRKRIGVSHLHVSHASTQGGADTLLTPTDRARFKSVSAVRMRDPGFAVACASIRNSSTSSSSAPSAPVVSRS